ncbi:I10R1 protein, partial [Upupa epops]|nr:I10R1 protein [Upupa epops]
ALLLCVALLGARSTEGERLAKPTGVHFDAQTGHHLLRWEPGPDPPRDVRYEVEHKVYGSNVSWTAIPSCRGISGLSCDLTYYTLDPSRRYYARVRALWGNHTSSWQRTNSFSPQEASLRLAGQSISVMGNTIHVKLQLLLCTGNLSVRYDDVQRHVRQYRVHVRRLQDNQTFEVMETSTEFSIQELLWDTEYCVSVEPGVASRRVRPVRTREHCVTTGQRDRSAELGLSIGSSFSIMGNLLGLLGLLLVCTYIKKPVRPPAVLKSFIKQSSLWMEESLSSSSPDTDRVQQLFLCHKDRDPSSSSSAAQPPLEKGWRLPAWPEDQGLLLGLGARGDRSCTSTDSGICLHSSTSSSSTELSCSSSPQPQGYKQQQLPTGDDSGVGLGRSCPHPPSSSSPTEATQPHGGQLPATGQDCQPAVEFRGYLQQPKVEPREDPAPGFPQGPGSADLGCSELAVAKGYLKQFSTTQPPLAPWGHPTAWDFSSLLQCRAPTLLSYGAPGAPKAGTELPRAPLDLGTFNTDLLGMLPLVSGLSTCKQLTQPPLSLLHGDS